MQSSLFRLRRNVLVAITTAMLLSTHAPALPVFPGAQGFGTDTVAGRGGQVLKVTTLADYGSSEPVISGSLRWAVTQTGPRVIVFEVAGVIALKRNLLIDNPYCTIAGQTAPFPGITLKDRPIWPRANHILIQHISSRVGPATLPGSSADSITVAPSTGSLSHVVIDHVSTSWASDESVSVWSDNYPIENVTYSNCIIAEPLGHVTPTPHNAYGPLAGRNTKKTTFLRNIFTQTWFRNPLIRDTVESSQVVDNFIFHPGQYDKSVIAIGTHGDMPDNPNGPKSNIPLVVSAVGNVVIKHPSVTFRGEPDGNYRYIFYVDDNASNFVSVFLSNNRLFVPGNSTWYPTDGNPYNTAVYHAGDKTPAILGSDPFAATSGVVSWGYTAAQLETAVKQRAGKFPAQRDAIDTHIISKINARTGTWNQGWSEIQTEYGSDPWAGANIQNTRALTLPTTNWTLDSDGDGYTDIEEWLHTLSAVVEGASTTPTLVGHWTLNATSGATAADSSGNSNTGTLSGGPLWTPAQVSGGLSFDGVDDAVNAGSGASLDNLAALTVAAWIKPTTMGETGKGRIVDKSAGTSPTNGWSFHVDGANQLAFRMDYSTTQLNRVSATNAIATGAWRHVVATWDGTTSASGVKIYVNGVETSYASSSNGAGPRDLDAASNLFLGNESTGAKTFHGVLDDVRVYNGTLSAGDVLALYQAGSNLPAAPTGLAASSPAYNQINLTWADNSSNETGFKIERKKGSGGTYAQIGTTGAFSGSGSYSDTTAGAGTQYYYRIRAYNGSGDSSYSNEANASTAEITSGRQAHWKLNENTGTLANDESANNNDGTLSPAPAWTTGKSGAGLNFDGVDDAVNAGSGVSLDQLPSLSVAAWIKPTTMGETGKGRIIDKSSGTSPTNGWCLHVDGSNQLAFRVDYSTTQLNRVSTAGVLTPGAWQHVLATWDGTTSSTGVKIFVNGVEVGYASSSNAAGTRDTDSASNLFLGNESTGAKTFHGALDDVRVYNRVLSASEIQAIHRAGL